MNDTKNSILIIHFNVTKETSQNKDTKRSNSNNPIQFYVIKEIRLKMNDTNKSDKSFILNIG